MKGKHNVLTILAVILILSMLLSACGGGAVVEPPKATEPTQAPAAEPTKAPEAAPAATEAPAAAPAAGLVNSPAEVRVAIVPGGPHPYFLPMEGGLADSVAAFGLGESAFKSPADWNLDAQNQLINSMVAQGFNAFGIFPGDANATNSTVDELVAKGIPVIATAGCLNEPTKSTFCLATNVGQSAYLGTKALIEALGGKGKILHGTGKLVDPNTQLRIEAVKKAVAETNGAVTLVETLADIDDQESADKKINAFLAARGNEIDGIVTSAYIPSTVSATALRNLGDKRIKMVGIDDDPIVLDAIKDGFLVGTMAQNPYGQAYIGAQVLSYLKQGCTRKTDAPTYVDSGTLLISEKNLTTYPNDLKALTKQIGNDFADKYLDCPAGVVAAAPAAEPAAEPAAMDMSKVRVAIVPGGPHPYFLPMEGGLADSVAAFGLGESAFKSPADWNLDAQNQLINSMVAQGFNAFGIFPGDANATNSTVDELVAKGIPVIATAGCLNEPTKSTFCLATNVGQSAYLGTKALIEALGGKGKILHGTGKLVDPNTQLRIEAVKKAVAETNGAVTLVETLADIDDQESADKKINAFLAARGNEIDGIVTSAYIPSTVSATALRNLGDKRIKMVGIDDDPIVLDAIKDGFLVGTMAQNPYGQAYIGAQVLGMLVNGCTRKADAPNYVDSGTLLISEKNLTTYPNDLKTLTQDISKDFASKYLDCPQ